MLVLTRGVDQEIVIGSGVVVRVCGVTGGRVKIGVTAPAETPVHRREVWEKKRGEGRDGSDATLQREHDAAVLGLARRCGQINMRGVVRAIGLGYTQASRSIDRLRKAGTLVSCGETWYRLGDTERDGLR